MAFQSGMVSVGPKNEESDLECSHLPPITKENKGKEGIVQFPQDKACLFHRANSKTVLIPQVKQNIVNGEEHDEVNIEEDNFEDILIELSEDEDTEDEDDEEEQQENVGVDIGAHQKGIDSNGYMSPSKLYKLEVIRRLLANFNLEDTINKYRSLHKCKVRVSPFDFTSDCAAAAIGAQRRLQALMGSDVITLNDYQYMSTLQDKLKQEYEAEMDRREREREDGERQRLRRLMVEGVILPEDLAEDSLLHRGITPQPTSARGTRPTKKSASGKRLNTRTRSAGHLAKNFDSNLGHKSRPVTSCGAPFLRVQSACPASRSLAGSPAASAQTQVSRMRDGRRDTLSTDSGISGSREDVRDSPDMFSRPHTSKTWNFITKLEEPTSPSRRRPRSCRFHKFEHPLVEKLKREETVSGLYEIADSLVLPSLQQEAEVKRSRPPPPKSANKAVRMMMAAMKK